MVPNVCAMAGSAVVMIVPSRISMNSAALTSAMTSRWCNALPGTTAAIRDRVAGWDIAADPYANAPAAQAVRALRPIRNWAHSYACAHYWSGAGGPGGGGGGGAPGGASSGTAGTVCQPIGQAGT